VYLKVREVKKREEGGREEKLREGKKGEEFIRGKRS
jgi:hypothetical protein